MKRVAVLGGGPAGAFAAERLASSGVATVLVDEKLAWEKPCGGGLTWKAWSQYPFLINNSVARKSIQKTHLTSGPDLSHLRADASLELSQPLLIYSRFELNGMLLRRAEQAGAAIEKTRVTGLTRTGGGGWTVQTRSGSIDADYCIVATGGRNGLREVGTEWSPGNTLTALGYFIPADQDWVDLHFFPDFEGYIWIFPRQGHLSAGIAGKGKSGTEMRSLLDRYLADKGISTKGATYYGHMIPSLERDAWPGNRVAGDGWVSVGDAAGLVDPVTGEGLYYALRSADLAVSALTQDPTKAHTSYRSLVRKEITEDLEAGSRLSKRLFLGRFLFEGASTRMIQFMRRSPTILDIVQDLFAGTQSYLDLKERLLRSRGQVLRELLSMGRAPRRQSEVT